MGSHTDKGGKRLSVFLSGLVRADGHTLDRSGPNVHAQPRGDGRQMDHIPVFKYSK